MGKGDPVLFVHGWGGNIYTLHKLACLTSQQYCVYTIDLPGFGKSDNPGEHWGVEGYAVIIKELIQKLKLKKPHFIGQAFGGDIGIYLASRYGDVIDRLIICSSSFRRENKVSKSAQILKHISRKQPLLRSLYSPLRLLYYSLFYKDSDILKYPHIEKNFRKIITQDLSDELQHITNKTLILWGERDSCTLPILAYELQRNIRRSRLHVYPDGSHDFPAEYSDLVWAEIDDFLHR